MVIFQRTHQCTLRLGCRHVRQMHASKGAQLRVMKTYLSDFGLGSPCGFGRAADRSDRLITDDGSKVADPIQVILDDHRKAAEMLRDVLKH